MSVEKNSKHPSEISNPPLSPTMRRILSEEIFEADISSALDAAFEEGIPMTRAEAAKVLNLSLQED